MKIGVTEENNFKPINVTTERQVSRIFSHFYFIDFTKMNKNMYDTGCEREVKLVRNKRDR